MKKIIFLLSVFISFLGCQQKTNSLDVQEISMDDLKYAFIVKKNGSILYNGNFDSQNRLPVGTHFLYTQQGDIDKIIEYQFSENSFEGVSNLIQITYEFKNNRLHAVKSAERCTECEFTPIGIWKYYDEKGSVIRELDTALEENKGLEHPEYAYYWRFIK